MAIKNELDANWYSVDTLGGVTYKCLAYSHADVVERCNLKGIPILDIYPMPQHHSRNNDIKMVVK